MADLSQQKCVACSGNSSKLSDEEIKQYQAQVTGWEIKEQDGEKRLEKCYKYSNFMKALAFTQKVGEEAENQGHHPALLTEWGKVTVTWWTHDIGGLHQNDFVMAAKTDKISEQLAE